MFLKIKISYLIVLLKISILYESDSYNSINIHTKIYSKNKRVD